jgi:mannose-6-phosphate isomerase-like protein (cupin superfamily)
VPFPHQVQKFGLTRVVYSVWEIIIVLRTLERRTYIGETYSFPRSRNLHPPERNPEMVIRNWKQVTPYVGHETAVIWPIFRNRSTPDLGPEEAPLISARGFTRHMMQGGQVGDYHDHENVEQIYYFIEGSGKMKIDDVLYPVKAGDSVHLPPRVKHQLINDTEEWIEHLIVSLDVSKD